MTARDVIRRLEKEGWFVVTQAGSHRHYKHTDKPGRVTVPIDGGKDIPRKVLASIYRQAGWTP